MPDGEVDVDAVAAVFRAEAGQVVASLVRRGSSIDQAEDALQEAFAVAMDAWRRDGLPARPGGWIATTAKRRLIDRLRRESRRSDKELLGSLTEPVEAPDASDDDRLRLIFTCCHPALSLDVRVALTLRATCGLSTMQIASLFLVSESTMAQRLVRGQRKIAVARIPFAVPTGDDLAPRLDAVLAVVYTVFTAGYNARGAVGRDAAELCREAIRLGRLLHLLMPREGDVVGLLALMLLHDARRGARVRDDDVVLFDDQDRARWDTAQLAEGLALVERAPRLGPVGQYWLQAAIAAEHMGPTTSADRNWGRIVVLYERLVRHARGAPIMRLNHAIAVSMADGPERALVLVDDLADQLASHSRWHAARADLLGRIGRTGDALEAYESALGLAEGDVTRRSLHRAMEKLR